MRLTLSSQLKSPRPLARLSQLLNLVSLDMLQFPPWRSSCLPCCNSCYGGNNRQFQTLQQVHTVYGISGRLPSSEYPTRCSRNSLGLLLQTHFTTFYTSYFLVDRGGFPSRLAYLYPTSMIHSRISPVCLMNHSRAGSYVAPWLCRTIDSLSPWSNRCLQKGDVQARPNPLNRSFCPI